MPTTSMLQRGSTVTDDRVPGKVGVVIHIIDALWVVVEWEHLRTQCAKHFTRQERSDNLSLSTA